MARAPSRRSPRPSRWPRTATPSWSSRGPTSRASPSPRTSRSGVTATGAPSSSSSPSDGPTYPLEAASRSPTASCWTTVGRTRREPHRARSRRRRERDAAVSAVVIDGGAPVIDSVDIVLDGDRGLRRRRLLPCAAPSRSTEDRPRSCGTARGTGSRGCPASANSPTFEGNIITGQHIAVCGRRSGAGHPWQHLARWCGHPLGRARLRRHRRGQRHRRVDRRRRCR